MLSGGPSCTQVATWLLTKKCVPKWQSRRGVIVVPYDLIVIVLIIAGVSAVAASVLLIRSNPRRTPARGRPRTGDVAPRARPSSVPITIDLQAETSSWSWAIRQGSTTLAYGYAPTGDLGRKAALVEFDQMVRSGLDVGSSASSWEGLQSRSRYLEA